MSTIFMSSKNIKISDLHRLLLNLTDKIYLKRKDKYITLSIDKFFIIHRGWMNKKQFLLCKKVFRSINHH